MTITLLFDCETSGLTKPSVAPLEKQPHIIELCALLLDGDKEVSCQTWFFKPPQPISKEITAITGITNAMLEDAPAFADMHDEVLKAFTSADEFVAHNLSFDKRMIDSEFARCGTIMHWKRLICTVEQTENLKGFRLSLGALHEMLFGEKMENAHRAENDVRAMARCFLELRKRGEI